jgi:hypothetical protein
MKKEELAAKIVVIFMAIVGVSTIFYREFF